MFCIKCYSSLGNHASSWISPQGTIFQGKDFKCISFKGMTCKVTKTETDPLPFSLTYSSLSRYNEDWNLGLTASPFPHFLVTYHIPNLVDSSVLTTKSLPAHPLHHHTVQAVASQRWTTATVSPLAPLHRPQVVEVTFLLNLKIFKWFSSGHRKISNLQPGVQCFPWSGSWSPNRPVFSYNSCSPYQPTISRFVCPPKCYSLFPRMPFPMLFTYSQSPFKIRLRIHLLQVGEMTLSCYPIPPHVFLYHYHVILELPVLS